MYFIETYFLAYLYYLIFAKHLYQTSAILIKREAKEDLNAVEDEGGGRNKITDLLKGKVMTEVLFHSNGSAVTVGNKEWDDKIQDLLKTNKEFQSIITPKNIQSSNNRQAKTLYTCIECLDYLCNQEAYCHNAAQCFQAYHIDSLGKEIYSKGCISKVENIPFICATSYNKSQNEYYNVKCCQENMCNNGTFVTLSEQIKGTTTTVATVFYIVLAIVGCIILISALGFVLFRKFCIQRKLNYFKYFSKRNCKTKNRNEFKNMEDSSMQEILTESVTSGSGSGLPLFVQRTLAKNICLDSIIGKGRYGEVYKGTWQAETVAVKIFSTKDESSWARETEIYSTVLLRHENILGYYGSDIACNTSCTQLWLVMSYHPRGSLFDYLQLNTLDYEQLFTILYSITNGVLFLHTEIMGNQGKPAIAHRDINSKNVLVKEDGTCCISDLGIAVVRVPESGEINISDSSRTMTKRYMSPEVLNQTLNMENFDSFRKSDVYSTSLVMWEAASRCVVNGHITPDYEVPFANIFTSEDPPFEEVRNVVCAQCQRPYLLDVWLTDDVLRNVVNIIEECWHSDPDIRLTALRIKKNLNRIIDEKGLNILT